MNIWSKENLDDIIAWVEAAYPEEGCGLILEDKDGSVRVMRCENLANKYHAIDPETYPRTAETFYMINPMEFVKAERREERVAVIFHSHADVGDYFSEEDIAGALMPRFDEDEPLEPSHPGVDYLVVSVRDGKADHVTLFQFKETSESFENILEVAIEDGTYRVSERA